MVGIRGMVAAGSAEARLAGMTALQRLLPFVVAPRV